MATPRKSILPRTRNRAEVWRVYVEAYGGDTGYHAAMREVLSGKVYRVAAGRENRAREVQAD